MSPPQKSLNEFFIEKYGGSEPPKKSNTRRSGSREEKKFVDTMMYGIAAPIVFGSKQWASTFPDDMREWAGLMRLAKAIECFDSQMCTLIDVVAYFYPLSMDAPMRHEYVKMYMYAYKHGLPDKWKILVESDPDIERMTELYDNEMEELNILRKKIFKKQMDHVKSHG